MGHSTGLDAVVKRKIPSPYQDSNPRQNNITDFIAHENMFCCKAMRARVCVCMRLEKTE
jgi:hypothetical protein